MPDQYGRDKRMANKQRPEQITKLYFFKLVFGISGVWHFRCSGIFRCFLDIIKSANLKSDLMVIFEAWNMDRNRFYQRKREYKSPTTWPGMKRENISKYIRDLGTLERKQHTYGAFEVMNRRPDRSLQLYHVEAVL